jgi:hypothetical protein
MMMSMPAMTPFVIARMVVDSYLFGNLRAAGSVAMIHT